MDNGWERAELLAAYAVFILCYLDYLCSIPIGCGVRFYRFLIIDFSFILKVYVF